MSLLVSLPATIFLRRFACAFLCAARFGDRRVRNFLDGSAHEVTLRSTQRNLKGRWAAISHDYREVL